MARKLKITENANAVGVVQIVIGITLVLLIQRLFMTRAGEEDGR